jgi:hypothetical protein
MEMGESERITDQSRLRATVPRESLEGLATVSNQEVRLGGFSSCHSLENRQGYAQNSGALLPLRNSLDRNPFAVRVRIGNHLKLLTVHPDSAGDGVPYVFESIANFLNFR